MVLGTYLAVSKDLVSLSFVGIFKTRDLLLCGAEVGASDFLETPTSITLLQLDTQGYSSPLYTCATCVAMKGRKVEGGLTGFAVRRFGVWCPQGQGCTHARNLDGCSACQIADEHVWSWGLKSDTSLCLARPFSQGAELQDHDVENNLHGEVGFKRGSVEMKRMSAG